MITHEQFEMLCELMASHSTLRVLCGMQVFDNVWLSSLQVPLPRSADPRVCVECTFGGVHVISETAPRVAGVDMLVLPAFERRELFMFSVAVSRYEGLSIGRFKLITEVREQYTPPDRLLYPTSAKPLTPMFIEPWVWFREVETFVEVLT